MRIQEVRTIAKKWGVSVKVGRKKEDIIRDIQIREGYKPCFRTGATCSERACLWFVDCMNTR